MCICYMIWQIVKSEASHVHIFSLPEVLMMWIRQRIVCVFFGWYSVTTARGTSCKLYGGSQESLPVQIDFTEVVTHPWKTIHKLFTEAYNLFPNINYYPLKNSAVRSHTCFSWYITPSLPFDVLRPKRPRKVSMIQKSSTSRFLCFERFTGGYQY